MKASLIAGLALVSSLTCAHAQTTIGTYDFAANSLNATDANSGDGIALSALNLNSFGELFDNANLNGTGSVSGFLRLSGNDTSNSLAAALSGSLYLGFTVTNNSGQSITLNTLSFDYKRNSAFEMDYAVFSNAQGFDSLPADIINSYAGAISGTDASFVPTSISLTSGFEGSNVSAADFILADGASRQFFIALKQNSTSNTRAVDLDNLSLSYTSNIPEPSAATLLIGLGALATSMGCRRRR